MWSAARSTSGGRRAAGAAALAAGWLCAGVAAADDTVPGAGAPAPDFTLPDLLGGTVRLSDLTAGGPVVLSFWATWCKPCALEAPHLSALQRDFGPRGLTVLGIGMDDASTVGEARSWVRRLDVQYRVALDADGRVGALYNPEHAMPLTVLIGRDGRVRHVHRGYTPGDEAGLRREAALLLEEAAPGREGRGDRGVAWAISSHGVVEHDRSEERTAGFWRPRIDATWGDFAAGVRYDVEAVRTPGPDGRGQIPCGRTRPGHSYVEWSGDRGRVRAGDSYAVLGRGLLLHLSPVGAFGVESTVLGGEVEGTLGPLTARALGGVTHASEIPQALRGRCAELFNPVVGARIEGRAGPVVVGVHGVQSRREAGAGERDGFLRLDPGADGFSGVGASVDASLAGAGRAGGPHLYAEVAGVRSEGSTDRAEGKGLFASLSAPMGPLTVTLEGKRYDGLDLTYRKLAGRGPSAFPVTLPYNLPPTLNLPDIVFEAAPDQRDTTGARVRIDVDAGAGWVLGGSLFQASEVADTRISDPVASVEWRRPAGGRASLRAGWRREERPATPAFSGSWGHAAAATVIPLSARHSLDLLAQWKSFLPDDGGLGAKTDLQLVVGYGLAPAFEAAVIVEHREFVSPEAGVTPGAYASASVTWRPTTDGALTAFAGSDPGGLRCTSGVCRVLPPFEGGRLELSLRY